MGTNDCAQNGDFYGVIASTCCSDQKSLCSSSAAGPSDLCLTASSYVGSTALTSPLDQSQTTYGVALCVSFAAPCSVGVVILILTWRADSVPEMVAAYHALS